MPYPWVTTVLLFWDPALDPHLSVAPHPRGLFYSTDSDRDVWIFSYFHTVETEFLHKGLGSLYLLEEARTSWLEIKVRKSCCPAQQGGVWVRRIFAIIVGNNGSA